MNETEVLENGESRTQPEHETMVSGMPVKGKKILLFGLLALLFILSIMMIVIMMEGD